jgi:flagellar basal-body rod modification protein FlgD
MTAVQTATNSANSLLGAATAAQSATSSAQGAQDRFLALLVAQMKNQDPLNPLDNAQFTTQLAQISTVNGVERVNETLQSLRDDLGGLLGLQSASLAGRRVLVAGESMQLQNGRAEGGFELTQDADRVVLTILDGSGVAVHRTDLGPQSGGIHTFEWDGATDSGALAAQGAYRLQVEAYAQGAEVPAQALSMATVDGVSRSAGVLTLSVGALGTRSFADVRQII